MSTEDTLSDPHATLEIQNVVVSSALNQEIDLSSIAVDLPDADFDPEQFPGVIYRPENAEATCLIFRSGKIICTGAGSIDRARESVQAIVETVHGLGIDVGEPTITIQNIVSDADLGEGLNLEAIAIGLGLEDVEYEPEQFPGLIYRLDEPDTVVLLFGTGKTVITGAETRDDAENALDAIIDRLNNLNLFG